MTQLGSISSLLIRSARLVAWRGAAGLMATKGMSAPFGTRLPVEITATPRPLSDGRPARRSNRAAAGEARPKLHRHSRIQMIRFYDALRPTRRTRRAARSRWGRRTRTLEDGGDAAGRPRNRRRPGPGGQKKRWPTACAPPDISAVSGRDATDDPPLRKRATPRDPEKALARPRREATGTVRKPNGRSRPSCATSSGAGRRTRCRRTRSTGVTQGPNSRTSTTSSCSSGTREGPARGRSRRLPARGDGRIGLLHPPGSELAGETDIVRLRSRAATPEPGVAQRVREELDVLGAMASSHPLTDNERDGRGKVLYASARTATTAWSSRRRSSRARPDQQPRPLAQLLPDPVELILDLAQPLVVPASPLGGGDQQERVLFVDEALDAGEQARLGRTLGGIAQLSRDLRRRNAHRRGRRPCGWPVTPRVRAPGQGRASPAGCHATASSSRPVPRQDPQSSAPTRPVPQQSGQTFGPPPLVSRSTSSRALTRVGPRSSCEGSASPRSCDGFHEVRHRPRERAGNIAP